MKIDYSETESRVFEQRVGRLEVKNEFDEESFVSEVKKLNLDFVRVKFPIQYEYANIDLYKTGLPFFFAGAIKRYEVDCLAVPLEEVDKNVSFELYTAQETEKKDLKFIMTDTWGKYPLGYYRTPGLSKVISKEKEMNALYNYYSHFLNNAHFPNGYLWFLKHKGELAGFIALNTFPNKNFEESYIDSTIAGISSKFQNQRLFPNILRHIRAFCRKNEYKYFRCGARLENFYSQKAFEKDYMHVSGVDMVYHVICNKNNLF